MAIEKFLKHNYKSIAAFIMLLFFAVSTFNAYWDSATFDEVAHIPSGYTYLTQHEMRLNPEHPPLLKDLIALPLLALHLTFDTSQPFWIGGTYGAWDAGQWEAGKYLLYQAGNNPDLILFWARMPIVLLSVILGLFLFKWGKELWGVFGGFLVLILYATDPNVLGHNHYVTTDLGIAAFITFAFYYFLRFVKNPSWKNTFVGGAFLALALLAKFSSLIILPILGLIVIVYPLVKKISREEQSNSPHPSRLAIFSEYLLKSLIASAFAMVIIWVVYACNTFKTGPDVIPQTMDFFFHADDPNLKVVYTRKILNGMNSNAFVRPMGEYLLGVAMVFRRVAGGNEHYFLGEYSSAASPIYFPVVFLLKETIPFLLLILVAAFYSFAKTCQGVMQSSKKKQLGKAFLAYLQTKPVQYSALLFIALYVYLSITGNLNIGFRHLFPILPFIYLLVAGTVTHFLATRHYRTAIQLKILLAFLVTWLVLEAVSAYPGYVSYFNEAVGGSQNGYTYVTDSNTDWGQDLKRLGIWIDEYNTKCATKSLSCPATKEGIAPSFDRIEKIRVDYFGGGSPAHVLGEKYIGWWDSMRPVQSGWYAISVNSLQGSIYDTKKSLDENYSWTLQYAPIAMVGNSILIYYVP